MTDRSEKAILNDCMVAVSTQPRTLIWRNNTGMAWQGTQRRLRRGETIRVADGMVVLTDARAITFGLPGSGDIIGVSGGVAVAGEVKTRTGRQREQQGHFQRAFEAAGGRYGLWRSPEDALADLRAWGCI